MKEILNNNEYQNIINNGKPVLLDFYADWCGPCQSLMPIVEKLSAKYENEFTIAKVNVDKNQELARQFGVRSIPALFILENGTLKEKLVGFQTEAALDIKIKSYVGEIA